MYSSSSSSISSSSGESTIFNFLNNENIMGDLEKESEEEVQQDNHEECYLIDGFETINNNGIITTIYRNLYNGSFSDSTTEPEIQDDSNLFEEIIFDYHDIERIYEKEYLFLDSEKINNKYYIGIYTLIDGEPLLGNCISPTTFFEFPINTVQKYLSNYSIIYSDRFFLKNVNILKLSINETDGTYNVIIKTIWLRLFQRKWKKLFTEKKSIMEHKKKLSSMMYFEINGKWPPK